MSRGRGPDVGLSTSTLSAIANISSSISECVDLELVEEIIERAPRSATSFPLVYRAYGQVLEQHGLAPSTDTAYYQFLLKLGVIRAPTWGEKWDLYKATQGIALSPPAKHAAYAPERGRLPFLASASSDLDEAYGAEEEEGEYQADGESFIAAIRPSPRKVLRGDRGDRSRSLVGYTPSQSIDYDAFSLNPPIRTSTPVYAQGGRVSTTTSPPLPPYSVSDVSEILHTASDFDHGPSTPKARHAHLIGEDELDEAQKMEMERLADEFYRTGIMGRCWDVWYQSHDWIKRTNAQIDDVRSSILLRQTLTKWREALEHQLSLPGSADRHRCMTLQSRVMAHWLQRLQSQRLERAEEQWTAAKDESTKVRSWKKWRILLIQRHTDRWRKDMAKRERTFAKAHNVGLVLKAFEHWHERMRDRVDGDIADEVYVKRTLSQALAFWIQRTTLQRKLRTVLENRDQAVLENAFFSWKQRRRLVESEGIVSAGYVGTLVKRVWSQWQITLYCSREARLYDEHRVQALAWRALKAEHARLNSLKIRASGFSRKMTLRKAMTRWVVEERGQLFARVRDVRLLSAVIERWHNRQRSFVQEEGRAIVLADHFARGSLHRTFSRWRARLGDHQQMQLKAALVFEANERKSATKLLIKWHEAAAKIKSNVLAADTAQAFFAQRQALRIWQIKLRKREQKRWIEAKQQEILRLWFDAWRFRLQQSREDAVAIEDFQLFQDKRLMARILSVWTARVVEIKSKQHDVIRKRNTSLKRDALSRWVNAARRVQAAKDLSLSHMQVREEDLLRRVLLNWRDRAIRLRNIRTHLEQAMNDRDDRLVIQAFCHWRETTRERALRPVEEGVSMRREDALMFDVWDKWKARSMRLPAVTFDTKRVVRAAFTKWKKAAELKDKERSVILPRDRQLLVDVLSVWGDAMRSRLAANAAKKRGRIRPRFSEPVAQPVLRQPVPSRAPATLLKAGRRVTMQLPYRVTSPRDEEVETVASEPAYSRLRSELYARRRGGSEEPDDRRSGSSELVRQLRGTMGR